jgi:hypothetical protein
MSFLYKTKGNEYYIALIRDITSLKFCILTPARVTCVQKLNVLFLVETLRFPVHH